MHRLTATRTHSARPCLARDGKNCTESGKESPAFHRGTPESRIAMKATRHLLLIFICSVALAPLVFGENPGDKKGHRGKQKTQQVQSQQHAGKGDKAHSKGGTGKLAQGSGKKGKQQGKALQTQKGLHQQKLAQDHHDLKGKGKGEGKMKHFDLKANRKIERVNFKEHHGIAGAEKWKGEKYDVFRHYHAEWHDRAWWHAHHSRIVLVFGGWYFWDAGWWYPAWGYAPNSYYVYDGPIRAHRDLPPDQVVANVQSALQQQGYYHGEIDGLLGPITRDALAAYQRDHGLYETSAIDDPTLEALELA